VPLNRDFVGRRYRSADVYEVSREKIREFAIATRDSNPAFFDPGAAKALGHPDVIAPPSFAFMLYFRFGGWPLYDPGFGKKEEPVCLLRAQQVVHARPIRPGDLLTQTSTVNYIRDIGPHEQWMSTHEIATVAGEHVCTVINTMISRGTAETEQARGFED